MLPHVSWPKEGLRVAVSNGQKADKKTDARRDGLTVSPGTRGAVSRSAAKSGHLRNALGPDRLHYKLPELSANCSTIEIESCFHKGSIIGEENVRLAKACKGMGSSIL